MNDHLHAAGYYYGATLEPHAFVATARRVLLLGLGSAQDINAWGVSVGQDAMGTAVLWSREGVVAGHLSAAYGINLRGDVVGTSLVGEYDSHAMLVPRGGTMRDLNDLVDRSKGWLLQYANDINDAGEIVGYGIHEGRTRAYLLRPRP